MQVRVPEFLNHSYAAVSEEVEMGELIAAALREKRTSGENQNRMFGFKIDVGIIDPNDTSRYMLGILCDGENYRAAKTARDRRIVQDSVLKNVGMEHL